MNPQKDKARRLKRRCLHIRRSVVGTPERPRLALRRSLKHIQCQVIDDHRGHTLFGLTSTGKEMRGELADMKGMQVAKEMGKRLAARAVEKGVKKVVFDRAGRKYHGRVKAFCEGAREGGLEF